MKTDFYETNLRTFPNPKPLDYEDIPTFGSLSELLISCRTNLDMEIRFVRTGGTLPLEMIHSVTVPVENGYSPGQLVLLADRPDKAVSSKAVAFLESLAHFVGDAYRWQQSVRQQEEENVPLTVLRRNEFRELSLFDILKDSAQLLGYNAAALYRLDSAEKTLRTSSVWGLPEERLLDSPRFLHDSLADVEAILGQVVVLNEDYLFEVWQTPEDFPMAVCVPIISSSAILGTLWLYADKRQDLTEHELGLLEFVAARIAADWELSLLHRDLRRR